MENKGIQDEIQMFKENIDRDLAHLDIREFIVAVALTPKEKKYISNLIKQIK